MSVVESELRFFEVKVEGVPGHTFELSEAVFGEAPEGLDAIDVVFFFGELVLTMSYPEVFGVADVNEPVVTDPTVCMDDRVEADLASYDLLEGTFTSIGDNLSPHFITAFENAKDERLSTGASTSLAFDSLWSKVGFVELDSAGDWCLGVADRCQPLSDFDENVVDRPNADARHPGRRTRRQVFTETANDVPKFGLRNFRRLVVLVNPRHHRSIAPLGVPFAS
jgi:hypothetical protein